MTTLSEDLDPQIQALLLLLPKELKEGLKPEFLEATLGAVRQEHGRKIDALQKASIGAIKKELGLE